MQHLTRIWMNATLLVAMIAFRTPLSAQIISIPDIDLAVKLYSVCPLAVDTIAQTIDSSHPQAQGVYTLTVNSATRRVSDLTGLTGLTNLHTLIIQSQDITTINDLPSMIWDLQLSYCNSLTEIQAFPPSLLSFKMEHCNPSWMIPALPNTLGDVYITDWAYMPPWITWPSNMHTLLLENTPMTTLTDLPETLLELYLANTSTSAIVDENQQPHLPGSLIVLGMEWHEMTALPALPPGLESLTITSGPLTDLPALPAELTSLNASGNDLSALPPLPAALNSLIVSSNSFTTLPVLPASLTYLRASYTPLTELPDLPQGLSTLIVDHASLTSLPDLPPALYRFDVSYNPGLTQVPPLIGTSIRYCFMQHCEIDSVPDLPVTVQDLSVSHDPISVLPALPPALEYLDASNTDITFLPPLPASMENCIVSYCYGLSCAPWLPPAIQYFRAYATDITCIPNQPASLSLPQLGIPLVICDLSDPCPMLNPGMLGTSYIDLNNDGVRDVGESPLPFTTLQVAPGEFVGGTGANGRYAFGLDVGTWSVTGIPSLYQTISSAPATATFTAWPQIDSLNDVGYYLDPNIQDLVSDITVVTGHRPGFDTPVQLTYRNAGTITQSGSFSFTHDAATTFVGASTVPDMINGNTITWNFTGMQVNEHRSITVTLNTPIGTPLGTPITHTALADPLATDETPVDNVFTFVGEVTGSYDPNDKQVEPEQLSPEQVMAGTRVTYTVRFQNTGTAPAERVLITDTLSTDLQWNTIDLIASSHACTWYMKAGVLHVLFENIDLPDSASDELNSHGFVKFSFVPSSSLMIGDQVGNTANIYFDFNEPVITNEAVFTVEASTAVPVLEGDEISIHPNPVNDQLWVDMGGLPSNATFEITDVTGREVMRVRERGSNAVLDVSGLGAGTYRLSVLGNGGRVVRSFVKR